ncbi:MAG: Ig-like domain-containing protein [Methanosarcina barkeri]|nr:Ig-like domain-containing protein [Methanosarcina sp. ERenArc_MAG2]
MNKWCKFLLGAFAGAAIIYAVKKHMCCCSKCLPEVLKSFSVPFKHGQAPPKVKSIYPDRQTFAFRHDSPIWIEFDMPMNNASITKETVIVRSSASTEPVEGLLDAGSRTLMFRPYGEYPMDESGAEITITLLGSETGCGVIIDEQGIALDGDNDGKAGGDFEYTYIIIK